MSRLSAKDMAMLRHADCVSIATTKSPRVSCHRAFWSAEWICSTPTKSEFASAGASRTSLTEIANRELRSSASLNEGHGFLRPTHFGDAP